MRGSWLLAGMLAVLAGGCAAAGSDGLTTAQAAQHAGEKVTVCGVVASAHYADTTEGEPTFVNLDQPYPAPVFTILIWGDYRDRFTPPPETWQGRVCVTGVVRMYQGHAEMKVISPSQIER